MSAGAVAGLVSVLVMAGTAAVALLLLGGAQAGRLDRLTAAVVAMAAGAPAQVAATPSGGLPIALHGRIDLVPLGISVVGAVIFGILLVRRGREGLLWRGSSGAVVFTAAMGATAWFARGRLTLPFGGTPAADAASGCPPGSEQFGGLTGGGLFGGGLLGGRAGGGFPMGDLGGGLSGVVPGGGLPSGLSGRLLGGIGNGGVADGGALDAGFAVGVWPSVGKAAVGTLLVVGLCWLVLRFPALAGGLRGLRWPVAGLTVVGLVVAWGIGGPAAAGAGLLGLPFVLLAGLPWDVHTGGLLSCVLEGPAGLPTGGSMSVWPPAANALVGALLVGVLLVGLAAAATLGRRRVDMLIHTSMQSTCVSTRQHEGEGVAVTASAAAAARVASGRADRTGRETPRRHPEQPRWRAQGLWPRTLVRAAWTGVAGGVLLLALALVGRVSVGLSAQAFILTVPLLDVRVAADPWVAVGTGVVAAAVGSLIADAFVSWRHDASR